MKDIIDIQKKIIPEAFEMLEKRYEILRSVFTLQPIGRRALANHLSTGERIVRGEVEFLKNQGLIDISAAGMTTTKDGDEVIDKLKDMVYSIKGIKGLEEELKCKLKLNNVVIVAGNSEKDAYILEEIAGETSRIIETLVKEKFIIGVTGGSTMAAVAKGITQYSKDRGIIVVPARGGLGTKMESQANSVAAEIAGKLKGNYHLLHASDTLSEKILESIMEDPDIQRVIDLIKQVNMLVFGIGRAGDMAKRRDLSTNTIEILEERKAVSEAFGYYFNINGEIVYETRTIGIQLEDFIKIPYTIGVAAGPSKAEAIVAISKLKESLFLITDEGAAREILEKY